MSYLTEAFKALDALNEDTFSVSDDGIKKLAEFEDNDDLVDEITVYDADAEDTEDLEDSYVGKVIVDCNVCHSKIYKDKSDVVIDEETQNANIDEECPYCYSTDGFKVIGEVAPMTAETEEKVEVEDDLEESLNEATEMIPSPWNKYLEISDYTPDVESGEYQIGDTIEGNTILAYLDPKERYEDIIDTFTMLFRSEDGRTFVGTTVGDRIRPLHVEDFDGLENVYTVTTDNSAISLKEARNLVKHAKNYIRRYVNKLDSINLSSSGVNITGSEGIMHILYRPNRDRKDIAYVRVDVVKDGRTVENGYPTNETELINNINKGLITIEPSIDIFPDLKESLNEATESIPAPWNKYLEISSYEPVEGEYAVGDTVEGNKILAYLDPKDQYSDNIDTFMFLFRSPEGKNFVGTTLKGRVYPSTIEDFPQLKKNEAVDLLTKENTIASVLSKHMDELSKYTDANSMRNAIIDILDKSEIADKDSVKKLKRVLFSKKSTGALLSTIATYMTGEKVAKVGRRDVRRKAVNENIGTDIDEYQQWVDYDMKRYGKISDQTNKEIKEAGLQVVKDKYGDYQVIAGKYDESLKESVKDITITTDDSKTTMTSDEGKVTLTTEPVEQHKDDEVIEPLTDETEAEIEANDGEEDIDIEDFDEESFDELGEGYFKNVYENVNSFKASNITTKGNKVIVEGVITFDNNVKKNTSFLFESANKTKNGKYRFIGENLNVTKGNKAFSLIGNVTDKKFLSESMNYNYRTKNDIGKFIRCCGTIKRG